MKIRCNQGDIIKITRPGLPYLSGKVIEIFDDEVVICTQQRVDFRNSPIKYDNTCVSADTKIIHHVNTNMIADWTFATVQDILNDNIIRYIDDEQWSSLVLNHYDNDGFCKSNSKISE